MEGLAHMGFIYGNFDRLEVKRDSITGSVALKLEDSPMAFDVYNNAVYLVTTENFYIIRNWKAEPVIEKAFLGHFVS